MVKIRERPKTPAAPPSETAFSRGILAAYGVCVGWLGLRLLNLSGKVTFKLGAPVEGIQNYCLEIGYPKQQDYFWYFAVILSAWAGAALALGVRWVLRRNGWKGSVAWWPALAGIGFLTSGFLTALPWQEEAPAMGIMFAIFGAVLPWFDTRWMASGDDPVPVEADFRPSGTDAVKWGILGLLVAFAAGLDPCIDWRNLDGIHEGVHLSYVQSWLVGDRPGLEVWPEYAPLYVYSIIAWMKALGITVFSERLYFQTVQILGTALHILALRWACRTRLGSFMGFFLMVTLTLATYVLYGASNSMRTAVAFCGMVACWRGLESSSWRILAGSGALFGVALLYSQEYAGTCLMPCFLMFAAAALVRGWRPTAKLALAWAGGIGVTMAVIITAIFRADTLAALARMTDTGYGSSRLAGHGARPFPIFPRISTIAELSIRKWALFENAALWWPALMAGGAGAWLVASGRAALTGRRLLAMALIVSGLVMQVPAIVRPMGHLTTAGTMIPILGLAALVVDWMWGRRGPARAWAYVAAAAFLFFGVTRLYTFKQEFTVKWGTAGCAYTGPDRTPKKPERLGKVRVGPEQNLGLTYVTRKMQELCPRDSRIYLSAPTYNHLLFLADRAGLPPYPTTTIAASSKQRAVILEALEKYKPRLAMLTDQGVDIAFAKEHKEEMDYINRHYRLMAVAETLKFYVRVK